MKILYRDYIAMLVVFFIGVSLPPEIPISNIKFYGIAILTVLLWYLGSTRTTQNTRKVKDGE